MEELKREISVEENGHTAEILVTGYLTRIQQQQDGLELPAQFELYET